MANKTADMLLNLKHLYETKTLTLLASKSFTFHRFRLVHFHNFTAMFLNNYVTRTIRKTMEELCAATPNGNRD